MNPRRPTIPAELKAAMAAQGVGVKMIDASKVALTIVITRDGMADVTPGPGVSKEAAADALELLAAEFRRSLEEVQG